MVVFLAIVSVLGILWHVSQPPAEVAGWIKTQGLKIDDKDANGNIRYTLVTKPGSGGKTKM